MTFSLRSFSSFVSTSVATAQASCSSLLDMGVGTPGRALMEAVAGVALWLQYLIAQVLARTRLSTSVGEDCDSFVNDFGMTRLQGVAATGIVTMKCFSTLQSAVIRPGTMVRTVSAVTFGVVADVGHPQWSAGVGGYVRQAGMAAIDVPVQAVVAGRSGNVEAGAISLMGTAVAGIDAVSNDLSFTNGADTENDAQLRLRFPLWLGAKATACRNAIESAIYGVQSNLKTSLMDGVMPDGCVRNGYFTAVVDDGSGNISGNLMEKIYDAIDGQRALGVAFSVQRPLALTVNVGMRVTIAAGVDPQVARTALVRVIQQDVLSTAMGAGYAYSRLSYLAYVAAGVDVLSVNDVLLNGTQSDIGANSGQTLVVGQISLQIIQGV